MIDTDPERATRSGGNGTLRGLQRATRIRQHNEGGTVQRVKDDSVLLIERHGSGRNRRIQLRAEFGLFRDRFVRKPRNPKEYHAGKRTKGLGFTTHAVSGLDAAGIVPELIAAACCGGS